MTEDKPTYQAKHKHEYFVRGRSKRQGEVLLGCRGCAGFFQAREYRDSAGNLKMDAPYQTAKKNPNKKRGIALRLYEWQKKRIKANKTTAQRLLDEAVNKLPDE